MSTNLSHVPHLETLHKGPLHFIEAIFLNKVAEIESWFREQWKTMQPSLTSSVDLRHNGLKLAPVDTNLFPAGFNNLNPDFMSLCVQAVQSVLVDYMPKCKRILVIPESHSRNKFYMQSLKVLTDILKRAGFIVRIGSMQEEMHDPMEIDLDHGETLLLEPLQRQGNRLGLDNFNPCLVLLNNDLSEGIPEILQGLEQVIMPTAELSWASRLKSNHFHYYEAVADEFSKVCNIDPWLINPYFSKASGIDFMAQEGLASLAETVDQLLEKIRIKYEEYRITETPYVVVKADQGTYGMSVMSVSSGEALKHLSRKQRKRMNASKGSQKVERVIIQEGVHSLETMEDGAVAEPVVYMIGQYVVGGFYRVHAEKAKDESLNAPGMQFKPLAFAEPCNLPRSDLAPLDLVNRFYAYGVVARLAALAAAKEIQALGDKG